MQISFKFVTKRLVDFMIVVIEGSFARTRMSLRMFPSCKTIGGWMKIRLKIRSCLGTTVLQFCFLYPNFPSEDFKYNSFERACQQISCKSPHWLKLGVNKVASKRNREIYCKGSHTDLSVNDKRPLNSQHMMITCTVILVNLYSISPLVNFAIRSDVRYAREARVFVHRVQA